MADSGTEPSLPGPGLDPLALRAVPGAVFLGDPQFDGDAVAGHKIVYMAPEERTAPAQLPADLPDFTGRQALIDRLDELITLDGPRTAVLTAIHGMAGVGKTALAVHWAHQVAGDFADGQLYVDLRGYSADAALTPIEALGRFLRAFGVPDQRIPEDEDERAALYRSMLSGRRMLIILDNAASPNQVRPLLPGSPTCLAVVTSRHQLKALVARGGATTVAVDVLSSPESISLIATIVGAERVKAEPRAAAQLAQQCAYLPLALRIAGAHVAMGTYDSIAELVDELAAGDRLAALECDDDPELAVRAAFDLSYSHLAPPVRRAFRRLGLLAGPDCTAQLMAVLLSDSLEETRRLIRVLVSANLLQPRTHGRFRLHDLLREYARERVTEEEPEAERKAAVGDLITWYTATAERHGRCLGPYRFRLSGPPAGETSGEGYPDALAWFEAERMGLVAAAHQAAELGVGPPVWELADAAYDFLRLRRYDRDNIRLQRLALAAARTADVPRARGATIRAYALHHLAALHRDLGGYTEALKFARQALQAGREADRDATYPLHTLRTMAIIHWRIGRNDRALDCLAEQLRICQEVGDPLGEASTLTSIALVYSHLARYQEAIEHLEQAVRLERATGNRRGEGGVLHLLASVHRSMGYFRRAAEAGQLALAALRADGDRSGEARTLTLLTYTSRRLGEHRQALGYAEQALAIRREIGDRLGEGLALDTLSELQRRLGHYRIAEELAVAALELRREIGDRPGEAYTLETLARGLSFIGRDHESFENALRALRIRREIGDRRGEAQALDLLAQFAGDIDRLPDGLAHAEESLAIRREIGDRKGEGDALSNMARMYRKLGRPAEGIVYARRSLEVRRAIGDRRGEAEAIYHLARISLELGHLDEALERARESLAVEREIDDLYGQGWTFDLLAEIEFRLGHGARAVQQCERSLEVREQIHDRHGQRRTMDHLARIHLAMNRPDLAFEAARRALDIVREYSEHRDLAHRLVEIADLAERTQGAGAALTYRQEAASLAIEIGEDG